MKKENRRESKAKTAKSYLKKFWDFVWNDNSWQSWIVSIILAFVLIRFVFYPLIGLIMGTSMPIVAVISSSMEHTGEDWTQNPAYCSLGYCTQEEWYLEKELTPTELEEFSFSNGFNKGDIMIILGKKPEKIKLGDVIVFEAGKNYPIIHRVVAIHNTSKGLVFETKGDNNPTQIITPDLNERQISENNIKGIAKLKIPYLGYIKIAASKVVFTFRDIFMSA